jgi:hypothetical protein
VSSAAPIRRWKRWLRIIERDIVTLFHQRHIFREIAEMFRNNAVLRQSGGTVWLWLAKIYTTTAAVGVRRQADRSRRRPVVSLERLLTDVIENPRALGREWFVRQYVWGKPPIARSGFRRMAERDFNKFAGSISNQISTGRLRSDRRRLRSAAARVGHYVNKRVAHRALRGYRGPARFADLDAAIDELGRLLQRCQLLINQAGMFAVEPVIQDDWEAIFRVPWK